MAERRIFISATSDKILDDRRRFLKKAILSRIVDRNLVPQEFFQHGAAADLAWTFDNVEKIMRRCVGAVVLAFPRWILTAEGQSARLVGEYNHYEGAVALTHQVPTLLMAEDGVEERAIVWSGGGRSIVRIPVDAGPEWLTGSEFFLRFDSWMRQIETRRDVFLGYCGKSSGRAAQVELSLQRLGATVHNWEMDFRAGSSILGELERARTICAGGIFLFTEDDPLEGVNGGAAPRDNVVFEAGYFAAAKGPDRCLIIREGNAKMPADLGGSIYLSIDRGGPVQALEGALRRFINESL